MKATELQNKSAGELAQMLQDLQAELRQLRFDVAMRKVSDIRKLRSVRRDIARILTVMNSLQTDSSTQQSA